MIADESKTPGKTQKLYFYSMHKLGACLVDCPGYGFAKATDKEKESWKKFMEYYLKNSLV